MSVVDDPHVGSPPEDRPDDRASGCMDVLTDAQVLERCKEIERRRRSDLAEHVRLLRELELRKLHCSDGHRDLAGFGRAEYRWADRDARAHRDLERFCRACPQVLDQLTIGRVGAAQVFLLAKTAKSPRVGISVVEQIDDFLDQAAKLSFLQFEQYVLAWKCLMDADGPDPDRAHRDRKASYGRAGLTGVFNVEGPAMDLAKLKELMARFEDVEFRRDWQAAKAVWGDDVTPDRLARTTSQRRYDAFQNLLEHVDLSTLPLFDTGADGDDAEEAAETSGDVATETARSSECEECRRRVRKSPVETVVNLMIDGDSFLHGLDLLLGLGGTRKVRSPFGPNRGFCQTFDGDPIALRDVVAAALADKIRIVLRNADGTVTAMSSKQRLFTGALRDAVLLTATACTHPGCTVAASRCQIDHTLPHSQGGPTSTDNGNPGCGHHNRFRHTAGIKVIRLPDGTIATHRRDGTQIAPPD